MPPDIPFNDGAHPHWSSSEEIPDSLIFWINCAPRGVDLHLCRTRNGLHESLLPAYLQDEQPLIMADLLLDDLRTSAPLATTSRHYLLIILLRLERMLIEKRGLFTSTARVLAPRAQDTAYDDDASRATPETLLVQRAQRFIQTHLTTTLTTRQLAGHLYISPSHLNRLFVRELGISPMQYFTQARMELARNLLIQSQHPIRYISNFFG